MHGHESLVSKWDFETSTRARARGLGADREGRRAPNRRRLLSSRENLPGEETHGCPTGRVASAWRGANPHGAPQESQDLGMPTRKLSGCTRPWSLRARRHGTPTRAAAKAGMTLIGFTRSSPAVSSILTRTLPLGDRTISRCAIGAVQSTFGLRSGRVWRSKMVAAMTRRGPASR
jgi:hypothetical protein